MLKKLFNNPYVNFLLTSAFFSAASSIYALCIPLIIFEMTKSATHMGIVRGIEYLPHVLFAIVIGLIFDRVNRKVWAVKVLILQAGLSSCLYLLLQLGFDPLQVIAPFTFLIMLMSYSFFNASFGIQKVILNNSEQGKTIARLATLNTFLEVIGPALSGYLIYFTSLNSALILVSILFAISAFFLSRVHYTHQAQQKVKLFEQLKETFTKFYQTNTLKHVTIIASAMNATCAAIEIQMLYTAKSILNMTAKDVGLLSSMLGVGGILGSLIARPIRQRFGLGKTLVFAISLAGIFQMIPAILPTPISFILANFVLGICIMLTNICVWTHRQEVTPAHLMGRMAGITGSLFKVLMPITLGLSGFLLESFGYQKLFGTLSLITLTIAFFYMVYRSFVFEIE